MNNLATKRKFGLTLGGGGERGLVHIGVLKALEKANIQIDFLSGTSMGGVITAAYATGLSPDEIESLAMDYSNSRSLWRLADPTLPRQGLFRGERLYAYFEKHLKSSTFADLRIPLTVVAVDINSGREVHLCEGSLSKAVRATVSVPGLLAPVQRNGQCLVDGGCFSSAVGSQKSKEFSLSDFKVQSIHRRDIPKFLHQILDDNFILDF